MAVVIFEVSRRLSGVEIRTREKARRLRTLHGLSDTTSLQKDSSCMNVLNLYGLAMGPHKLSEESLQVAIWGLKQGRIILDFDIVHTCCDYNALKEWSIDRDSEHSVRWPQNAARLNRRKPLISE